MKSFCRISFSDFRGHNNNLIEGEIKKHGKEYILSVDENDYCNYLYEKYKLTPLKVIEESEQIFELNTCFKTLPNGWGGKCQKEVHNFKIEYNFEGSSVLFSLKPSSFSCSYYDIDVDELNKKVSFEIAVIELDEKQFMSKKQSCYEDAFINIDNINKEIKSYNDGISDRCKKVFRNYKKKHLDKNNFLEAINVQVNKDTESIFTVPTVQKKVVPQPKADSRKEFVSEPAMSTEMYNDVLRVIYDSGKSMEKKPSLYKNKDEEALRDQFLFVLETRYEGTTATGETFNKCGKTDIILKYAEDGSNLFVAECKFWHGASEFLSAINQLFDRYLTWRDSKVSLIMFVKNKGFSSILSTIKKEASKHPYFLREKGGRGETSFSYEFHLPEDKEKIIFLEVMAFHYVE